MKYLLDTNIISEMIKPLPNEAVLGKLERFQNLIVIAAPVWHELWFGCLRLAPSRKREQLADFLQDIIEKHLAILPYDERASRWHAAERARLTAKGLTPPFVDGQIASIAVVNDLILVTRNLADFNYFNGLVLENWYQPNY